MKRNIILSLLVLLVIFSSVVMAGNYEVNGGYLYTKIDIHNDDFVIADDLDGAIKDGIELGICTEHDKIDVNDATGYFIELKRDFNTYKIGLQYEKFSQDDKGHYYENDDGDIYKYNHSFDIDIDGIIIDFEKQINKYIDLFIGIGRYSTDIKEDCTEIQYYSNGSVDDTVSDKDKYDVDSDFGYKLGAKLNYPLSSHWSILGNIDYRILKLDYKIDKAIDNNTGEEYEISQDVKDKYSGSLDLNGLETSVGISYSF